MFPASPAASKRYPQRLDDPKPIQHTFSRFCSLYNRAEIQVIVLNTGSTPFTIERGARIAQAVLAPVVRARWHEVVNLDATSRNEGGFGSTGR